MNDISNDITKDPAKRKNHDTRDDDVDGSVETAGSHKRKHPSGHALGQGEKEDHELGIDTGKASESADVGGVSDPPLSQYSCSLFAVRKTLDNFVGFSGLR